MSAYRPALVWLALSASPALAHERFLATQVVSAKVVTTEFNASADDKVWTAIPGTVLTLHPQRSIRLPDAAANVEAAARGAVSVTLKAAHNTRDLALWMEWADATEDRVRTDETNTFADAVAMEIPVRFGAGLRLPYVGMGDESQPVYLWMLRALEKGSDLRQAVAAGFGSLTRADLGAAKTSMTHDATRHVWRAVMVRSLEVPGQSLKKGLVPVALAAWDGAHRERGGNKTLSAWKFLRLEGFALDDPYVTELSWGYDDADQGDPARGKMMVEMICIACHRVGDKAFAPEGMAPDLSSVGGIATPSYLRQSLLEPSAVIVPSPNPNRHYAKAGPPDALGAYPNNEMYRWFTVDFSGNRTSKMPPFGQLPKEDVAGIVAYLRSLGADAKGEK